MNYHLCFKQQSEGIDTETCEDDSQGGQARVTNESLIEYFLNQREAKSLHLELKRRVHVNDLEDNNDNINALVELNRQVE